jgi:hypothetical protein
LLGTGTSVESDSVKLGLWVQISPLSEMMQSCKKIVLICILKYFKNKSEYREKTTHLSQVTDKLDHTKLYRPLDGSSYKTVNKQLEGINTVGYSLK